MTTLLTYGTVAPSGGYTSSINPQQGPLYDWTSPEVCGPLTELKWNCFSFFFFKKKKEDIQSQKSKEDCSFNFCVPNNTWSYNKFCLFLVSLTSFMMNSIHTVTVELSETSRNTSWHGFVLCRKQTNLWVQGSSLFVIPTTAEWWCIVSSGSGRTFIDTKYNKCHLKLRFITHLSLFR